MGMKDPTVIAIFIVDGREIYQIGHADYPYITAYERNGDVFTKIEEKGVCNCFKDWETQYGNIFRYRVGEQNPYEQAVAALRKARGEPTTGEEAEGE